MNASNVYIGITRLNDVRTADVLEKQNLKLDMFFKKFDKKAIVVNLILLCGKIILSNLAIPISYEICREFI